MVLNKNVSTGDDLWGSPWAELPPGLQVYGIGDICFGYICYSVLAGIMIGDLFPEPEIVCKILSSEQRGAISWILEWIVKSLEGVELHPDADKKASTKVELLSALRFFNSMNKIDKSPPPYIVIWKRLIGAWPSIVNGGCRYALQAHRKFLDQVRILAESKILWNHGRILLCPGSREKLYSSFGVDMELFKDSIWTEPCCNVRGLKRPSSIQPGMLDFNPKTVQTTTTAKFCSVIGRSQRFAT